MVRGLAFGLCSGIAAIAFSCVAIGSLMPTLYWWANFSVPSSNLIIAAIPVFVAGLIGMYGAVIGKKRGAVLMLATGIVIVLIVNLTFAFIGVMMVAGGIFTIREKPQEETSSPITESPS